MFLAILATVAKACEVMGMATKAPGLMRTADYSECQAIVLEEGSGTMFSLLDVAGGKNSANVLPLAM